MMNVLFLLLCYCLKILILCTKKKRNKKKSIKAEIETNFMGQTGLENETQTKRKKKLL